MAIETLMMTFGRPKQQADGGRCGKAGWDEAGHLPRKENNNKLKAVHWLSVCVCVCVWEYLCAFPFPARPRKHYKSFLAATCHGLSSSPALGLKTETATGTGTGTRGLRLGLWHFYEAFSQLTGFTRS